MITEFRSRLWDYVSKRSAWIISAHPEELLSLSKQRLEGAQACFETALRLAQALLSMSG